MCLKQGLGPSVLQPLSSQGGMTVPLEVWPGLGWDCVWIPQPVSCPPSPTGPECASLPDFVLSLPQAEPGVGVMMVVSEGLRLSQSLRAQWEARSTSARDVSARPVTLLRLIPEACGCGGCCGCWGGGRTSWAAVCQGCTQAPVTPAVIPSNWSKRVVGRQRVAEDAEQGDLD